VHAPSRPSPCRGEVLPTRERGVTLLETVAGLGLAAILAGASVVELVGLVAGARVSGAARTVATALRLARGFALADGATTEVRFDPARRSCQTRDGAGTVVETRFLPPGIAFTGLPARQRVQFGGLGTGENATIVIAAGARTRRIIVNQRGRVRVQ
jgi:Tfp pilus assembly protein FimT